MVMTPGSCGTGLVPQPHDPRDLQLASVLPTGAPAADAYSIEHFLPPVPNQYDVNWCQSVTGLVHDAGQRAMEGLPYFDPSWSYTYALTKARDGDLVGDNGGTLRAAMASIAGDGRSPLLDIHGHGWPQGKIFNDIHPLHWWRQQTASGSKPPFLLASGFLVSADPTEIAHRYKAMLYMAVMQSIEAYETAISHNHFVSFGIPARASLFTVGSDGVIPLPAATEQSYGYHALTACGYNRTLSIGAYTGFLRIIGSWGTAWADKGKAWLPYDWFRTNDPSVVKPFDAWSIRYAR